ncbi:MAG: PhzF family phenazine biosynthesis protein, partial [Bacteroidales bacterium]|nr:PhzF family phenazine biosynthesis protein [Bacteroidales bacterium]
FNCENHSENIIRFYSPRSGDLIVTKNGELLTLNFPTDTVEQIECSAEIKGCFNIEPQSAFKGKTDFMLVFRNEEEIEKISPNLEQISKLNGQAVIATAKGEKTDFVSRFFAPQLGINEDHVTGSAHTTLTPYWANQLGKTELTAIQLSSRKGYLQCRHLNDRVEISGQGKLYLVGEIYLE